MAAGDRAAARARATIRSLYDPTSSRANDFVHEVDVTRPWTTGYAMARPLRHGLGLNDTDGLDVSPWVGLSDVSASSNGIQGFVSVRRGRCGLVLGGPRLGMLSSRFAQARALGRALVRPEQQNFILSVARGHDERVAGAFAAELLAPAEGIRQSLYAIGKHDDSALEAVARHFKVSPLLVRHQYDNQIAVSSHKAIW